MGVHLYFMKPETKKKITQKIVISTTYMISVMLDVQKEYNSLLPVEEQERD